MRILFFLVIFGFSCLISTPVMGQECSGTANLTTKFQDGLPSQEVLELKSTMDWSWLTFDFDGRISSPNYTPLVLIAPDEEKSGITAVFGIPYLKKLAFKTTQRQEQNYWKNSNEYTYDWRLFKWFSGKISYQEGARKAISGGTDRSTYDWDKTALSLGLDFNFISYDLDYSRKLNDYPHAAYYSSIAETLAQKVHWHAKQDDLTFSYHEATGVYPYDLSYTRAYWHENWGLNLKHEFSKKWRCTLNYGQMQSEKGFRPYRDGQSLNTEVLFNPDKVLEISFQSVFNDIHKSQNTVDLPGDWEEEEEANQPSQDTISHTEQKVALTCRINLGKFLWDLGFYKEVDDYKADQKDKMNSGIIMTLHYKMQPADIVFKIAPQGDVTQSLGFYQLKLQFKF